MLLDLMHRAVAQPWCYDTVQILAGARTVRKRVAAQFASAGEMRVLDLGGGTGAIRPYLPVGCKYISLDMEMPKLQGFRRKYPAHPALLADCTQIPVASRSMDVVLCMLMSHHLTDAALTKMVAEAKRVLKLGGQFIFLDCVLAPERPIGRLLWRLDRGSFPRRPEILTERIEAVFPVISRERFSIWHEYVLLVTANPE